MTPFITAEGDLSLVQLSLAPPNRLSYKYDRGAWSNRRHNRLINHFHVNLTIDLRHGVVKMIYVCMSSFVYHHLSMCKCLSV